MRRTFEDALDWARPGTAAVPRRRRRPGARRSTSRALRAPRLDPQAPGRPRRRQRRRARQPRPLGRHRRAHPDVRLAASSAPPTSRRAPRCPPRELTAWLRGSRPSASPPAMDRADRRAVASAEVVTAQGRTVPADRDPVDAGARGLRARRRPRRRRRLRRPARRTSWPRSPTTSPPNAPRQAAGLDAAAPAPPGRTARASPRSRPAANPAYCDRQQLPAPATLRPGPAPPGATSREPRRVAVTAVKRVRIARPVTSSSSAAASAG